MARLLCIAMISVDTLWPAEHKGCSSFNTLLLSSCHNVHISLPHSFPSISLPPCLDLSTTFTQLFTSCVTQTKDVESREDREALPTSRNGSWQRKRMGNWASSVIGLSSSHVHVPQTRVSKVRHEKERCKQVQKAKIHFPLCSRYNPRVGIKPH